jgi:hypothetical protein
LLIEITDPMHPLVPAYWVHGYYLDLVKAAREATRTILFRPPGTGRSAEAAETAVPRVLDAIQRHLKD